jgi:hypothetical protein
LLVQVPRLLDDFALLVLVYIFHGLRFASKWWRDVWNRFFTPSAQTIPVIVYCFSSKRLMHAFSYKRLFALCVETKFFFFSCRPEVERSWS